MSTFSKNQHIWPTHTTEYSGLTLHPPFHDIIYSPSHSSRFDSALGVNILGGAKICSFNCPYCDLGTTQVRINEIKKMTLPQAAEVVAAVTTQLNELEPSQRDLYQVVVSGLGEPTLHPQFAEIASALAQLKEQHFPSIQLTLLTNGAHFALRKNIDAANLFNRVFIKVDAGSDKVFKLINAPLVRANLSRIISGAHEINKPLVQSLFVQGTIDNTKNEIIEDWIETVGMIRPESVDIYTLSQVPPLPGLKPVDEDTLYVIASKLKRRTSIESTIFTR